MRKQVISFISVLALMLGFVANANAVITSGAAQKNSAAIVSAKPKLINEIVAIVNNHALTRDQFEHALEFARLQASQAGANITDERAFKRQVLNALINQTIALQLAKTNNLSVSDTSLQQTIAHVAQANNIPLAELKKQIRAKGVSFSIYEKQIKDKLLLRKLEQEAVAGTIQVTSNEVNDYLAQQAQAGGQNTQYRIAHILIAPKGQSTSTEIAAAKKLADEIVSKIKRGLSFSAAAIQYSQASDGLKGGKLPWETLAGLPDVFASPVQKMQIGQVYGPFKAGGVFHIIKLIDKKPPSQKQHFVTEYQLKQIMVKTSPIKSPAAAKLALEHLRVELLKNPKQFGEFAQEYSDDHNSSNRGGMLGWVQLNTLPAPIAQAVSSMTKGALSQPINADNGNWYLVQLMNKRKKNDTETYLKTQAKIAIFNKKAQAALSLWESQIRGASYVKIVDPNLQ